MFLGKLAKLELAGATEGAIKGAWEDAFLDTVHHLCSHPSPPEVRPPSLPPPLPPAPLPPDRAALGPAPRAAWPSHIAGVSRVNHAHVSRFSSGTMYGFVRGRHCA